MSLSFAAINRMVEEKAEQDSEYRRQIQRNGKQTLSSGRALSDDALVAKLASLGLEVTRDVLDRLTRIAPSAQALATTLPESADLDVAEEDEDWLWIALTCLWERWFPERLSFEMIDDRMQAGYQADLCGETREAVDLWRETWRGIREAIETFSIESIDDFDDCFGGTQCLFNWVSDYSIALGNAAIDDEHLIDERLALCRFLLKFGQQGEMGRKLLANFRRDLADCHFARREFSTVDGLYRDWLQDEPRWGWGWIAWADGYYAFAPDEVKDAARAEQILQEALEVPDVKEANYITARLADLYQETDRSDEAAALRDKHRLTNEAGDDESDAVDVSRCSVDELIDQFDADEPSVREAAVREAARRGDEIAPRLIDAIRRATAAALAGAVPDGNRHFFAFYLLAQFQATDALPAIIESVSLPGELPFELYGDAITEDLKRVLATLAGNEFDFLDGLIADHSLNEDVRGAAAEAYAYLVRDGRMSRGEVVARLRNHLRESIAGNDSEVTTWLVWSLTLLGAREALDEVRQAFQRSLVNEWCADLEWVEKELLTGEERLDESFGEIGPTAIEDAVREIEEWGCFEEPLDDDSWDVSAPSKDGGILHLSSGDDWDDEPLDGEYREPSITVRNTAPRVGRNDPCPCGSGKKYKKCCGRH